MSDHISVRKENSLNLSLGNNNCEKKKGYGLNSQGQLSLKTDTQPPNLPNYQAEFPLEQLSEGCLLGCLLQD